MLATSIALVSQTTSRSESKAELRTPIRDTEVILLVKIQKWPQEDTGLFEYVPTAHVGIRRGTDTVQSHSSPLLQVTSLFHCECHDFKQLLPRNGQEEGTEGKRDVSLNPSGYMRKLQDSTVTSRRAWNVAKGDYKSIKQHNLLAQE